VVDSRHEPAVNEEVPMKVNKRRAGALMVAAVTLAVGLATAATAGATPPTRENIGVIPYEFSVDCNLYGFAFSNEVKGEESLWVETFYDADGNPVKVVVHDGFIETDTNSVTGKTLAFSQTWVNTFDLVAGTRTVVGKAFLMTDPGEGAVIQDTGRVVFDTPDHVLFEAGQHAPLHGDLDQLACTALAAA
jgi:hypothetical protein